MNNSVLCNLAIIPPLEVRDQIIDLSQRLATEDAAFALDGLTRFPHLTVYMARFDPDHVISAVEAIERALRNQPSFELISTGYFYTDGDYAEVSYAKSPALMELQARITGAAQAFRLQSDKPPYEDYTGPFSEEQRSNVANTGYDLAGELYRPHITITKYREPHPEMLSALEAGDYSFPVTNLGWFYADEYGACTELIRQFSVVD